LWELRGVRRVGDYRLRFNTSEDYVRAPGIGVATVDARLQGRQLVGFRVAFLEQDGASVNGDCNVIADEVRDTDRRVAPEVTDADRCSLGAEIEAASQEMPIHGRDARLTLG